MRSSLACSAYTVFGSVQSQIRPNPQSRDVWWEEDLEPLRDLRERFLRDEDLDRLLDRRDFFRESECFDLTAHRAHVCVGVRERVWAGV